MKTRPTKRPPTWLTFGELCRQLDLSRKQIIRLLTEAGLWYQSKANVRAFLESFARHTYGRNGEAVVEWLLERVRQAIADRSMIE